MAYPEARLEDAEHILMREKIPSRAPHACQQHLQQRQRVTLGSWPSMLQTPSLSRQRSLIQA